MRYPEIGQLSEDQTPSRWWGLDKLSWSDLWGGAKEITREVARNPLPKARPPARSSHVCDSWGFRQIFGRDRSQCERRLNQAAWVGLGLVLLFVVD